MKITCVADLHGHYPKLEGGDLLIVAGDLTARDTEEEYYAINEWFAAQDYSKIIVIAGNHDNRLVTTPDRHMAHVYLSNAHYLCDSGVQWCGLRIWGSPWTRRFEGENPKCLAFTCANDAELAEKWTCIPKDTDILVTHCPPWGFGDEVEDMEKGLIVNTGSPSLRAAIDKNRERLKLCVFGHIHEGYGQYEMLMWGPKMLNASHVDRRYRPVNAPITVEV